MKAAVISFTANGARLCAKLCGKMREAGYECEGTVPEKYRCTKTDETFVKVNRLSLHEWAEVRFGCMDILIFIGAAGIAVRAIGPFIKDKLTDPAVIVVDERGQFAISLLSGHVGGANRITKEVAELIGAVPVITTASDINGVTAVDVWAAERGLLLTDKTMAKKIAQSVLDKIPVGFFVDAQLSEIVDVYGKIPDGCEKDRRHSCNIWVTFYKQASFGPLAGTDILRLVSRVLHIGIGCRRDTGTEVIKQSILHVLDQYNLDLMAVADIASIDLKSNERGIIEVCREWEIPPLFFSKKMLLAVEGEFSASEFVKQITGVENVCERAAAAAALRGGRGYKKIVDKQSGNGVTVAVFMSL